MCEDIIIEERELVFYVFRSLKEFEDYSSLGLRIFRENFLCFEMENSTNFYVPYSLNRCYPV